MLLALKLLMAPTFIGLVTLAGRRWGPDASGVLTGLPLTSGPISLILALQHGANFAALAAAGSLTGQAAGCLFCLSYTLAARRLGWGRSVVVGVATFLVAAVVGNALALPSMLAALILIVVVLLVLRILPWGGLPDRPAEAPAWDLPARMAVAAAFVLALTTFAGLLGPHLSGLIAPFPVFGLILATFTHKQLGGAAAGVLLRGIVLGSWAYAAFFIVVGELLLVWAVGWTYVLATVAAMTTGALAFRWRRKALGNRALS